LGCARTLQLGRDNLEANQQIKPRWIGRAAFLSFTTKHDLVPLDGFGLVFGVDCWNLPLAHLIEEKPASDNALQSGRLAFPFSGERKGNHNADHQLQEHVHRRIAGAGKHGRATRR
jgi:hypothetical protein